MKNLIIFLFGVGVGAGGMLLWLRKDIKKELESISIAMDQGVKQEEIPFEMSKSDEEKKQEEKVRAQYHEVVKAVADPPVQKAPEIRLNEIDGGIFEITVDEYMHNHDYEQEHLIYFRGDCVMCTENGTVIMTPAPLVGCEWEQCVGNYAERTAFIRNEKLRIDYEIFVENGLYEDEYGVDPAYED